MPKSPIGWPRFPLIARSVRSRDQRSLCGPMSGPVAGVPGPDGMTFGRLWPASGLVSTSPPKSLWSPNVSESGEIRSTFQRAFSKMTFAGSNPACPASQFGLYAGTLRVSAWIEFHERKRWAHLSETGTRSRIDILQRSYPAFIILPCWEEVRPPDRHNSQVARPADPPAGRPDARDGVFAGRNTGLSP
jgi:hypothetical protein